MIELWRWLIFRDGWVDCCAILRVAARGMAIVLLKQILVLRTCNYIIEQWFRNVKYKFCFSGIKIWKDKERP